MFKAEVESRPFDMQNARTKSSASVVRITALLLGVSSAATALLLANAAHAQTAPEARPADPANGEIIVTAQRRSEALSRVPLSVTALSASVLQERAISSEQDLASVVPGLVIKNGQNQNQVSFTLRGQTLDPFSGASPAVVTYLNEVPFSGGNSATALFDFSSVQVLKGPQGTLFGRNATGGAVLYESVKPGDDFGGFGMIRVGERSLVQGDAAIDIPIVADKILLRISGDYKRQDGYVRNLLTGHTLGDINNKSGRATLVIKPTDGIENTTVFQYSKFGGSEAGQELYSFYPLGSTNTSPQTGITYNLTSTLDTLYDHGFFPGVGDGPPGPGTFPGKVPGYLAWQKAHPYQTYQAYDLPHNAHSYFVSNSTKIQLSDSLAIKNIFGYQNTYARTPGILSGSPFGSLDLFNTSGEFTGPPGGELFRNKSLSDELQLQGTTAGGRLEFIVGGFYNHATKEEGIPVIVGSDLNPPAGQVLYHTSGKDTSKAVYGQATYDLSDVIVSGLKITGGARYTWETVSQKAYDDDAFAAIFPHEQKKLKAPSWNATLQWQFDPHNQVYFTQRGSFRAGNYNGAVTPAISPITGLPENSFDSEYTHDFEVGYKFAGPVAGMRAHLNIAAYKQLISHAQHSIYAIVAGAPSAFTVNVPKAVVKGVEIDTDISLSHWLTVGFAGAYTDAKYTDNLVDLSAQTGTPGYIVSFDSYPDAPKWSGSAFADLTFVNTPDFGNVHFRVDGFKQSSTFFSNNNYSFTPQTQIKGYTTVAARLSWNNIRGSKVSAAIYVKNLFNDLYYQGGYVLGGANGVNTVIPGEPRTMGAEITARF